MKKIVLLFTLAFSCTVYSGKAQVTLSGTSYTENFDMLGSGIPNGWSTYRNATSSSMGSIESLTSTLAGYPSMVRPDTSCAGLVLGGGFKNFPSATVASVGDNWCAAPPSYSNRALGVRQVSPTNGSHPNLDPGAAFALQIANTINCKTFSLTFKLQSFDTSSPRITTWSVDYGFGTSPTSFTAASATGTLTTGGKVFSNNTINVNFGTALDNNSSPLWIRIVALAGSSGSGNRPSTAIDDFSLTWLNTAGIEDVASYGNLSLTVLGTASSSAINFGISTEEFGQYTLTLLDMTGRIVYSNALQLTTGNQTHTVNNTNLKAGVYIAKVSNGKTMGLTKLVVQ